MNGIKADYVVTKRNPTGYDVKVIITIGKDREYLLWYSPTSLCKEYIADMLSSAILQAVAKYKDDLRRESK